MKADANVQLFFELQKLLKLFLLFLPTKTTFDRKNQPLDLVFLRSN